MQQSFCNKEIFTKSPSLKGPDNSIIKLDISKHTSMACSEE
jgi:hypothetical protein